MTPVALSLLGVTAAAAGVDENSPTWPAGGTGHRASAAPGLGWTGPPSSGLESAVTEPRVSCPTRAALMEPVTLGGGEHG